MRLPIMRTAAVLALLVLAIAAPRALRAQASCDQDRSCVGSALTIQRTSGRGAQYVDVDPSSRLASLDTALTFEAWILPSEQPGRRQFVAGLWGPNRDNNDQWVVYIEGTTVTFALSPPNSRGGDTDNTVARATLPDLYTRGWLHLACVWDGASTSARILVDGFEVGTPASNQIVPLRRLNRIENRNLNLQIASCNALFDDTTRFRTFKGQIDEVRIWRRALSAQEIGCGRLVSMTGSEPGLALYYRCNDAGSDLCDATGGGARGRMRSGAACTPSDRRVPASFVVSPSAVSLDLFCTADTTLRFELVDTTACGSQISVAVEGRDASMFSPSVTSLALEPGVPETLSVLMNATITGNIDAAIVLANSNRCGDTVRIPLRILRSTEITYDRSRIDFDTLFVGCSERTYDEQTLEVCNRSNRTVRIDGASVSSMDFSVRPADPSRALPLTLQPGECWRATVRYTASDTTLTNRDTLIILTDDRCTGSGRIPLEGHTQEVFALLSRDGSTRVTALSFGAICPGQISDVRVYQLRNLVPDPVAIDTIIYPRDFYGRRVVFPISLQPRVANAPDYVRFRPTVPGPAGGPLQFVARYRGCTITQSIMLDGKGISVDIAYPASAIGYGTVTVGRISAQSIPVTNKGTDARRMSAYLKVGDVFRITAGRSFTIAPDQVVPVTVEFRPREAAAYYDTLCIFDEGCYGTWCVPISGTGVLDAIAFSPATLSLENVPGCRCSEGTIAIRNVTGAPVTIVSSAIQQAAGKFALTTAAPQGVLQPGDSMTCGVRYCPDDLTDDRADRATLQLRLSTGAPYEVLLRGTSVVPRLSITPVTAFGVVEVGWSATQRVLVENASAGAIRIDVPPSVPPGYSVVATTPALPAVLGPRDSLLVDVRYSPTAAGSANGPIMFTSNEPCPIAQSGLLTGTGRVVKLDIPLSFVNYGLVKPCDCAEREVPLPNTGNFIPISIDSVWIDGQGVTGARPAVFRWRSRQTGGMTLPWSIAPQTRDTLVVSFCPDIPAIQQNILSNAVLHVVASTPGWTQEFRTTLSGRRELNFAPNRATVSFPATRVDTASAPISVDLAVPDQFANPSGDSVVITGIAFAPDARVFRARAANNAPLPWTIRRGERFPITIDFTPRAPKSYSARLRIITSYPCSAPDTTVLVRGEGFAPAYGLTLAFDTARIGRDTFRLTSCDILELPVITTRPVPQDYIDCSFRIGYDTTLLQLIGISSSNAMLAFVADTGDGARARLVRARGEAGDTLAVVRFAARGLGGRSILTIDSIGFDSDSLVFYRIVPGGDRAMAIITQPRIAIGPSVDFDTVRIRDCAERYVTVTNPGTIPVRFDSLAGLPPGCSVTGSSRTLPAVLAPGDSIGLTIRFCAFREAQHDTLLLARSSDPCTIDAGIALRAIGWAPPYRVSFSFDAVVSVPRVIRGAIGDTVDVPVFVDRLLPQSPLGIDLFIGYNRRALQVLSATSAIGNPSITETADGAFVKVQAGDTVRSGELLRLRFAVAVPDSDISPITIDAARTTFASDSAFVVRFVPSGDSGTVIVDPKCNIQRLEFRGGFNRLSHAVPNPARGSVRFDLEIVDAAPSHMIVLDAAGRQMADVVPSGEVLAGGRYRVEIDVSQMPAGVYWCRFDNGLFRASERFVVVK